MSSICLVLQGARGPVFSQLRIGFSEPQIQAIPVTAWNRLQTMALEMRYIGHMFM